MSNLQVPFYFAFQDLDCISYISDKVVSSTTNKQYVFLEKRWI